ncbi:MAG: hypothetical protein K0R80_975 [Clostridia bacterium]|jgi:hypothetical protein|nr:hypothetical protein [Clostridia bacterium]
MKEYRPVEVSNGAFNFCKYGIATLLWLSIIVQSKLLVGICFAILVLSAIFKVKKAPLVMLFTRTADYFIKSKRIILDERAVRFAHIVGAVFSGIALIFLYFIHPLTGWIITGILALLKTSGAMGYCGAMKLYSCLNNPNGQCCRVGKKVKKYQSS